MYQPDKNVNFVKKVGFPAAALVVFKLCSRLFKLWPKLPQDKTDPSAGFCLVNSDLSVLCSMLQKKFAQTTC